MKATLASLAAVAVLSTGCATHQQTGALVGAVAGAAIAGPIGGTAAAHIGAGLVGGVVGASVGGSVGKHMDQNKKSTTTVVHQSTYVSAPVVTSAPASNEEVNSPAPVKTVKKVRE